MTSQRQFMKDYDNRIALDSDIFFDILGLRRVYVLQISLQYAIRSVDPLSMKWWIDILCFSELNALR